MNPKLKMKAELEEKYRRKYEEKLREKEDEFKALYAEAHAYFQHLLKMGMQQSSDAAMMAIDDVFDVNEYSAKKFYLAHVKYVNGISDLLIEDSKCDRELVYAQEDIDRRLRQIVGADNFVPWQERYGGKDELCNH